MTSVGHAERAHWRASPLIATLMIALPIALALLCLAARLDIVTLSQSMRATLLFTLLMVPAELLNYFQHLKGFSAKKKP